MERSFWPKNGLRIIANVVLLVFDIEGIKPVRKYLLYPYGNSVRVARFCNEVLKLLLLYIAHIAIIVKIAQAQGPMSRSKHESLDVCASMEMELGGKQRAM